MDCANLRVRLKQLAEGSADAPTSVFPFQPVRLPPAANTACTDEEIVRASAVSTSHQAGNESLRQHDVDQKAFKGRGARRKIISAQAAVDKVHEDMRRLAAVTTSIKAKQFYLALHTRTATGQLSLRWRRAGSKDTSHIAWDALNEFLAPLPPDLVRWYQAVNDMATSLNCQEKHNRAVLRHHAEASQQQFVHGSKDPD